MPIYEYICPNCNKEFEQLKKMFDNDTTHCPECNTPSNKKPVSKSSFNLKGDGWYKDGYK